VDQRGFSILDYHIMLLVYTVIDRRFDGILLLKNVYRNTKPLRFTWRSPSHIWRLTHTSLLGLGLSGLMIGHNVIHGHDRHMLYVGISGNTGYSHAYHLKIIA
jgi:hypothetical protein